MTTQERGLIKKLLPDLLSPDYVSLNSKRINFIYGQGVIIYDKTYAVEVYLPRNSHEELTFFAIQRHQGKVSNLGEYYRKIAVQSYDHEYTTNAMRKQFDEAVFQNLAMELKQKSCRVSPLSFGENRSETPVRAIGFKKRNNMVA